MKGGPLQVRPDEHLVESHNIMPDGGLCAASWFFSQPSASIGWIKDHVSHFLLSTHLTGAVLLVGVLTLVVVCVEFWLNHVRAEVSNIEIRGWSSGGSSLHNRGNSVLFVFHMNTTNKGKRDGFFGNRTSLHRVKFAGEEGRKTIRAADYKGAAARATFPLLDNQVIERGASTEVKIVVNFPKSRGEIVRWVSEYDEATIEMSIRFEDNKRVYDEKITGNIKFPTATTEKLDS